MCLQTHAVQPCENGCSYAKSKMGSLTEAAELLPMVASPAETSETLSKHSQGHSFQIQQEEMFSVDIMGHMLM